MPNFVKPIPMMARDFHDAERAVAHLGLSKDAAISLKLRPIKWNDDHTQLWDAYVYKAEYERAQKLVTGRKITNIGMGDRASLLRNEN